MIKGEIVQMKYRAQRTDNGEMVEGDLVHGVGTRSGRAFILPLTDEWLLGSNDMGGFQVNPDTLEVQINGEWMRPEAVEMLKQQRDGLLEACKEVMEVIKAEYGQLYGDYLMDGRLDIELPEEILLEIETAIAEAEADNE